jgi:hypothetical protein
VEPYGGDSASARARAARWELVLDRFPNLAEMRVVDLGGDARHWQSAPVRPRRVVLLNPMRYALDASAGDWLEAVEGDACDPPAELAAGDWDLVYSNSVIEHVGGAFRRKQFSESVHRLAPRHWVQTPYRYFPLEPHWLFPGMQFLPLAARAFINRHWPLRPSRDDATDPDVVPERVAVYGALEVELVSKTEMRHLFPFSDILEERAAGLVKSLIAVSRPA